MHGWDHDSVPWPSASSESEKHATFHQLWDRNEGRESPSLGKVVVMVLHRAFAGH